MVGRKPETADGINGERRSDKRYAIALDVRWRLLRRKKTLDSGQGHTVDLSTGGVLFETGRRLPVGAQGSTFDFLAGSPPQLGSATVNRAWQGGTFRQRTDRH